jgi:hypothetical protein
MGLMNTHATKGTFVNKGFIVCSHFCKTRCNILLIS